MSQVEFPSKIGLLVFVRETEAKKGKRQGLYRCEKCAGEVTKDIYTARRNKARFAKGCRKCERPGFRGMAWGYV